MWFTFVTHPVQISATDLLYEVFHNFPQFPQGYDNQPVIQCHGTYS